MRALDRHSEIVAFAAALEISPSELMKLPVPAPGNGHTDSATEAVRHALQAVSHQLPGGQVLPMEALRTRVAALAKAHYRCDVPSEVGTALQLEHAGWLALSEPPMELDSMKTRTDALTWWAIRRDFDEKWQSS